MQPEGEGAVVKCVVLAGDPLKLGRDLELRFSKQPLPFPGAKAFFFGLPQLYQDGKKLDLAISSVTLHFEAETFAEASVCFYPGVEKVASHD